MLRVFGQSISAQRGSRGEKEMKKIVFRNIGIFLLYMGILWILFHLGITDRFFQWIYDHVDGWQVAAIVLIIGASCLLYSVFQEKNA
jgi:hypothetical protein